MKNLILGNKLLKRKEKNKSWLLNRNKDKVTNFSRQRFLALKQVFILLDNFWKNFLVWGPVNIYYAGLQLHKVTNVVEFYLVYFISIQAPYSLQGTLQAS